MKNSIRKGAAEHLENLREQVSETGEKIGEFVSDTANTARERFSDAYEGARKNITAGARQTDVMIRDNPYESLVIVLGIGVVVGGLIGLLMGRRR